MRRRSRGYALMASVAALALALAGANPGMADFHIQAVVIADFGTMRVSPGLSDTPQRHESRVEFVGFGAAYSSLIVSANMTWDCRHDDGEDEDVGLRQGFTLNSLEADETQMRGIGTGVGRCIGWAREYPFPYELSCPELLYVRHDVTLELVGLCASYWGSGSGQLDMKLTVRLRNGSADLTTFDIELAVLNTRG